MPGDPNSTTQSADLNVIPASLIKRAEVLTGGASSVYGADAVAGVVNFIMDTELRTVSGSTASTASTSTTRTIRASRGGLNVQRHHRGSPGGRGRGPVPAADRQRRPTAARSTAPSRSAPASTTTAAMRSPISAIATSSRSFRADRDYSAPAFCRTPAAGVPALRRLGDRQPRHCGHLRHHDRTRRDLDRRRAWAGNDRSGRAEPLQLRAAQLLPAAGRALHRRRRSRTMKSAPAIKPYLEFMFMDDRTLAQIAPSGDFGNTLTINCDNPLMSARSSVGSHLHDLRQSGQSDQRLPRQLPARRRRAVQPEPGRGADRLLRSARGRPTTRPSSSCFAATPKAVRVSADLRHTSFRGVLGTRGDLRTSGRTTPTSSTAGPTTRWSTRTSSRSRA